jgi:transcriptional regulator with XRE-family HTH domain
MKNTFKRSTSETISEAAQLHEIDERHFLAQQIFFRREGRQWSQEELARASGLTQAQVATLEAGQANPTLRTLAKLADALSCGVRELFEDVTSRSPLNVPGIDVQISTEEIVASVREGRERS